MLYACASLSYSWIFHAWRPSQAWSCFVTYDAHKALFGCHHLGSISGSQVASYIPLPFCSVQCYAYHVCSHNPLAFYAFLHACSHVHAWVLLASASSMLQHNEVMDIRSEPTFVLHGHYLLFAFLFACFLVSLLAMSVMLICFMPLSYALCIFSLVSPIWLCTLLNPLPSSLLSLLDGL